MLISNNTTVLIIIYVGVAILGFFVGQYFNCFLMPPPLCANETITSFELSANGKKNELLNKANELRVTAHRLVIA